MLAIGFGQAEITPAPGSQSPGGFARRVLEKAADPLLAVALVIRSGEESMPCS
jgi:hypothetical protein